MPEILRPTPKAVYFGDLPSKWYVELNGKRLDFGGISLPSPEQHGGRRIITSRDAVDDTWYLRQANEVGTGSLVKIIPLPVCISPELSKQAIKEMRRLRSEGILTALRGGRPTDLARPLKPEVRDKIKMECPSLVELITMTESGIQGGDLFIRAIKLDEARASTTQAEADRERTHLHFDAEKSSLEQYNAPVYQFYANVSRVPRQFSILPIPLSEMTVLLQQKGLLKAEEARTLPLEVILERFTETYEITLETIVVESGQLAIFDGRTFAHDAGKGRTRDLKQGRFVPSGEPDFILALDTIITGYHEGLYDPNQSILEDPGTDAWWEMMERIKS